VDGGYGISYESNNAMQEPFQCVWLVSVQSMNKSQCVFPYTLSYVLATHCACSLVHCNCFIPGECGVLQRRQP
jgi:hypothetical protein